MRAEAGRRHPQASIRWVDDRLPGLEAVMGLGLAVDVILVHAVWMHVVPDQRRRAFRKLTTPLKPGGQLFISLRHGPAPPEWGMSRFVLLHRDIA
jgi:SAM-dependent methyltransferase